MAKRAKGKSLWDEAMEHWKANQGLVLQEGSYRLVYNRLEDIDWNTGKIINDDSDLVYLNGANIHYKSDKYYGIEYKVNRSVVPTEASKRKITSVDFTMPSEEDWLAGIFDRMPYGLVKKNRTGIGATTLELMADRNSIIVVPTKALASSKKLSGRKTDRYYHYVGGETPKVSKQPSIDAFLTNWSIKPKKFIVVADSLPKLIRKIGVRKCKDYFLMVDEIDSYQYDSNYRPNLENVMDCYFSFFPPEQRCLVSATVGQFSDPRINDEPVINIRFSAPSPRKIHLNSTNNVVETTAKKIESLSREFPEDKILVAYNSIQYGILPVIRLLGEELQQECAVMCSVNSRNHVERYYAELEDELLPNRITFMTCTYFVGVDIKERFHLISVADVHHPHTLLLEDKLQQIAGRCRHPEGLLSETLIYSTSISSDTEPVPVTSVKTMLDDAVSLASFAKSVQQIKEKFPKAFPKYNPLTAEYVVNHSHKSYDMTGEVRMIRQTVTGKIQPAYFNIDSLVIQQNLNNSIYRTPSALKDALEKSGHSITYYHSTEHSGVPAGIHKEIREKIKESDEQQLEDIINSLKDIESSKERLKYAEKLECSKRNQMFIYYFMKLQRYVPFDVLTGKLRELKSKTNYDRFYQATIIWALDEKHPLKCSIRENFPIGEKLTGDEIERRVSAIWNGMLNMGKLEHNQCHHILSLFCRKTETKKRIQGVPRRVYEIVSYDVNNLECAPMEYIPADENIHKRLDL